MLHALLLLATLAADAPSFNGFVSERLTLTHPRAEALLSTRDLALVEALTEANLQGRARVLDDRLLLSVDASAYVQLAGGYADYDPRVDAVVGLGDPLAVTAAPFVVFSEAFASLEPFDHLVLTAGKRRVVWGPGFAATATDVLNPPRDPTDPGSQREGAVLVALDVPFETFTLTAVFLPRVLDEVAGIPRSLYRDEADGELKYAAALRGYALIFDTDVNAWLVHANLWGRPAGNERRDELRAMATLARTLDVHTVHLEAQVKRGSGRLYPERACLPEELDLIACGRGGVAPLGPKRADEERLHVELLAGWRWLLPDDSMLGAEWLYQSDGLLPGEFQDLALLLDNIGGLQRAGLLGPGGVSGGGPGGAPGATGESATPLKFSAAFVRRHHVFLSYTKPQIADDFTIGATFILAPEDLTSLAAATGSWSAREWLTLSLSAYAPLPAPARAWGDDLVGEFDLAPFSARAVLEAKVWF